MISDIRFGRKKIGGWLHEAAAFYVYHNCSGATMINTNGSRDWLGIEIDIEHILSHETLHKVLFKLEGVIASKGLDKWCNKRQFVMNDYSGISLYSWELEGLTREEYVRREIKRDVLAIAGKS